MFVFKACPRCRGDLSFNVDRELTCLQCGRTLPRDLTDQVLAERGLAQPRRVPDAVAA